jgi:glycosyltransferase involved in cell wall biosynthesis
MKILAVGELFPWPAEGGGLMRLAGWVEALARTGDVDLFCLYDPELPRDVPATVPIARVGTVPRPKRGPTWRWRTRWLTHRGMPLRVAMVDGERAPRRAFDSWVADGYDLVWFNTAELYHLLGRPDLGPTIVDLDNLESEKERQRGQHLREAAAGGGPVAVLRSRLAALQATIDARDWDRFQRGVAAQVDRVALCSRTDVGRSGLANAEVVENSFRRPEHPLGRVDVADPPVILFQGTLNYQPNVDAAAWLVDDLAPRIRTLVPDAQVRLVGQTVPRVNRMDDPPAVTVLGRSPDMAPELARADIAVVPLLVGSGTRLKILESFAHRIPVVSTIIGADGLDVVDGVHLLLADDPDAFARACHRLLTEPDLRVRLAVAAEALFLERYESSTAQQHLEALVRDVATTGGRHGAGRRP